MSINKECYVQKNRIIRPLFKKVNLELEFNNEDNDETKFNSDDSYEDKFWKVAFDSKLQ